MRAILGSPPKNIRWHYPAAAAGMAAVYYAGATLGLALTFAPLPISVLWPPNALLLAALILAPRGWWWGLIAAAFPAHLLVQVQGGVPLPMILCWFASNVSEALLGALLMARLGGARPALRSSRSVVAFLFTAAAASFVSSLIDAAFVRAIGWGDASYFTLVEVRFFSNMVATLAFVPALVSCVQAPAGEFPRLGRARAPEATLLAAGLMTASIVAFNAGGGDAAASLVYLPVPFLVWAALRFGVSLSSTAFAGVTILVILGASHGKGPFAQAGIEQTALPIQLFLLTLGAAQLLLSGVIEDRRETERRLRGARELFSTSFRSAADAMAVSRLTDGHVLEANAEWLHLVGDKASGTPLPLSTRLEPASRGKLQQLARRGTPMRSVEIMLRDGDGQPRVALLWSTHVDVGGQRCEISTVRDITSQRQAEGEARDQGHQLTHLTRVASLADFSGTLAHELNQPLAAILSNAQAALRMLTREPHNLLEVRSILRDIADADKRAGVLIHHLRLLMKNSDDEFLPLDCNQVVQEVLDLVQGEFLLRKVALKTSFVHGMPQVRGDRVQLQQLILNLVLNACEAMQHGESVERVLSVDTHHDANGTVQILLSDTGPGIPRQLLGKVFDPFYTTKSNGLGLGLSICRKIAAAHGGTLTLQSRPGEGASFRFALPALPGTKPRAAGESEPGGLSP